MTTLHSGPSTIAKLPAAGLEHYDPEEGLKSVAVAEAAERHFRRAKDATRLLEAVELKLAEQRRFVLWYDAQDKPRGGRGKKTDFRSENGFPDPLVIHRWRTRLKDPKKYDVTLAVAQARCVRLVESYRGGLPENSRSLGTGEFEWYTPAEYVEAARNVLSAIELDPASSDEAQRTVKATRYFTMADDGLAHPWPGRVWLNPPYTQPMIMHFIAKLIDEHAAGRTTEAILLTHNYTDTAWFHLASSHAAAVCFTRGRISFEHRDGYTAGPTQGQAFFYYGSRLGAFWTRFSEIGAIMAPVPGPPSAAMASEALR
jgi:phage N-6-adenine-methyltransferase